MAIDILHCFNTEPPKLEFVLPSFLAGTVGVLAAAGSTGKSFWAMQAGMCVCSAEANKRLLNFDLEHHGRVVILNAEDPEVILHHRLRAISEHLPIPVREEIAEKMQIEALMGTKPNIMDKRWQDSVMRVSDGARLVIFDTLTRWHQLDENSNGEMSQVISEFEAICRETGAAVLFLHHVSKGMARDGRQDEQQATRGAAAITDNARWQGWMQVMSKADAELYGIAEDDRKRYVAVGGNKENYGQSSTDRWLERKNGGVLIPVELIKKEKKSETKKAEWRNAG